MILFSVKVLRKIDVLWFQVRIFSIIRYRLLIDMCVFYALILDISEYCNHYIDNNKSNHPKWSWLEIEIYLIECKKWEYDQCKWIYPVSFLQDIVSNKKLDNPMRNKVESDKILSRDRESMERVQEESRNYSMLILDKLLL